jgi:hypothetical protein
LIYEKDYGRCVRAVDGEKDIGGSPNPLIRLVIKGKLQKTKECHKSQSNTLVLQSLRGRVETQPLSFWYSRSIFVSFPISLSLGCVVLSLSTRKRWKIAKHFEGAVQMAATT